MQKTFTFRYDVTISSLRPGTNFRQEIFKGVVASTENELEEKLLVAEKEHAGEDRLRYFLQTYVDGIHLGHAEAPTVEMLLEKVGSFNRWLERAVQEGQNLEQYAITAPNQMR